MKCLHFIKNGLGEHVGEKVMESAGYLDLAETVQGRFALQCFQ